MNPTWKAAIGVILIFILGWFGGALTTLLIARHKALVVQRNPEVLAVVIERQTIRNLGLNDDQKSHVHALILDNLRQRTELQKQIQPQVRATNRQTLQEIDALLTADQQQRFHDNLVLFKERFGRNPFNVGAEDKAAQQQAVGSDGSASSTNTSNDAK
jgi:hypothetical protein